jgi:hypothetical protein
MIVPGALPALTFYPPQFSPWVHGVVRSLLPHWLRWQRRIAVIETTHIDRLVHLTAQRDAGKVRYYVAFRHPTTDDHLAMLYLFAHALPQKAREMGIPLRQPIHSAFIYDRGVALWAGEIVNWLFPRLGGISIYRGKLDRQALQVIRQTFLQGEFPIALAPEGATNGQSETLAQLEPGTAQMAFWGAEDLAKAGRSEEVLIVPVHLQYEYQNLSWPAVDRLLLHIEQESGITLPPPDPTARYDRLIHLGHHLIQQVRSHYGQHYPAFGRESPPEGDLPSQLEHLIDRILRVAEAPHNITPKGTIVDRCRRVEQATWDRIYRSDLTQRTMVERYFADALAREAGLAEWHMRLAESIQPISGTYIADRPSPNRYAEMLTLVWRALGRVKGTPFGNIPYLGDRHLLISVGEPISVAEHFATYQSSRSAAKECVAQVTAQLETAMRAAIRPSQIPC